MSAFVGLLVTSAACLLAILFFFSWTTVSATELALQYNFIFKTIDHMPISSPGLNLVGPFTSLIRYPKTIQTIVYDRAHRDLMDGRTKDGLPLILGLTFQYRLQPENLYKLYLRYENEVGDYMKVYTRVGIHIVTEEATGFTAYEFFNDKQKIAEVMRRKLDAYFQKELGASVESLQLNEDDLPVVFTETILQAATCKQNITQMSKKMLAKKVEFDTEILVAQAQANVTIQKAVGNSHAIMQEGKADAAIIDAYVEAEKMAYGKVRKEMKLTGDDLVKYIWYDTLGKGGINSGSSTVQDMQMFIGVSPSAYISPVQR